MASAVLACVESALDDLSGLMLKPPVRALRFQLRNLKTFLLCSRKKLVNDESQQLGSLLPWIEDVVRRKVKEIRDDANYSLEVETLEEEIQDWYITMLDDPATSSSDLMSADQLLELMSSILENLVEIYGLRSSNLHFEMLGEAMEALREQMAFLRCLVQIADPEASGDLMAHAQDVAVNAAYLIFTCRGDEKRKGTVFNISCLVQKIKPIDFWVYETYTQVLMSTRPASAQGVKSLLNSLISNLWEILLQLNTPHLAPVELHLKELYEGLRSLRTAVAAQTGLIGAVVCDAGVLICSLYHNSQVELPLRNLLESVNKLISPGSAASCLRIEDEEPFDFWREAEMPPPIANEMVGRQDDIRAVSDQLRWGSKNLQIIPIVGMLGIGKTTLALQVFNDANISNHFSRRAWCHASQAMDKERIMIQILNQLPGRHFDEWMSERNSLKVWRCLKGQRYLIVVDDIWSVEAFKFLEESFPDDNTGSRIILTSRLHDVAPRTKLGNGPYIIRELNRKESLELLLRRIPGQPPQILIDLAMPYVDICGGLPLTLVKIAGHLANVRIYQYWEASLAWLRSGDTLSEDYLLRSFDLSYNHLPDYLRPCFLYFATFPKNGEVSVRRLIRLWIAEGFIGKETDVAESYLKQLINRSLIIVSKTRSNGRIKACRLHVMLHDACSLKARDENIFHSIKGFDELSAFNERPGLPRLRIESKPEHFKDSKLFCPSTGSLLFNSTPPTERAGEEELFLDVSFLVRTFKFLHVLDIEQINVGHVFPSELEVLVHLAFVAIRGEMRQIPSSIGKLLKLETLIVDAGTEILALPDSLGNLLSLQFLNIRSSRSSGGSTFPATKLENPCVLHGLETFCGLVVPSWGILGKLMQNFPNIRRLKCRRALDDTNNVDKSVALDFLSQLESLHLSSLNLCHFKFRLPENLKKLTLSGFHLVAKKMSAIGMMPNLQFFKLIHVVFEGNTWEVKEGEFLNLKALKLHSPGLVAWTLEEDGLRCLEKVTLDGCLVLEEMPAPLKETVTLEVIDISNCSMDMVDSVMRILEEQWDYGNDKLKVFIDGVHRVQDD